MPSGGEAVQGTVSFSGEVPDDLDERVADRDLDPLPDGAIVKFQSISHSPDPRTNHRWVLHANGRLYLAFHSRDTAGAVPFDRKLPRRPSAVLEPETIQEIHDLLAAERFFDLAPYQAREGEGGMWRIVTARDGDREHEVIYDRLGTPLVDRLQKVATEVQA